jgi:putative salt-induced outer membrane protein YdiY
VKATHVMFGTLLALCALSAHADSVLLANGDHMSGRIHGLEGGKLVLKTEYAGDVRIDVAAIVAWESDGEMTVSLRDGERIYGRVRGDSQAMTLVTDAGAGLQLPVTRVVSLEQGRLRADDWSYAGRFTLGASDTSGNSETTRLNVDGEVVARTRKDRITVSGRANYATDRGAKTDSSAIVTLKYDRFLSGKQWYAYAGPTLEHDPFRDLKLRATFGAGSGYQAIENARTNLSLEAGLEYVHSDFYSQPDDDFPAGRLALRFEHWLWPGTMQFFERIEGYANIEDTARSFVRSQTGLRFPLGDAFLAQGQINLDWTGNPSPGLKPLDQTLVLSVGYKW